MNRRRPVCRLARCRAGSVRHRACKIGFPDLTCASDRRRSGRSNRSSTRRHGRNTSPLGSRAARATDSIGTLWPQNVRHASFIARNPLQRKTARATTKSSGRQVALKRTRGPTQRDGNAEAGSSGGWPPRTARAQPVSVAGDSKTSREALDQQPGRRCHWHLSAHRDTGGRAGRAKKITGRARSAWRRGRLIRPARRSRAHDAEAQARSW